MKSASVQKTRLWKKASTVLGWVLSKIADCVRMCFSSAHNRRSARTGRRPRKFERHSSMCSPTSTNIGARALRAPRANRVFYTDEKRIRIENTVMNKSMVGLGGFYTRSSIARGCAFHPCAIGDPRGRAAVRASASVTARCILRRLPMSTNSHCALRAPTVFSARMKSASAQKTRL